jgi:agmatinase
MSREKAFDPGRPGRRGRNLFGMPFGWREAAAVAIPVPWEVTVSYGAGTAGAPRAVAAAAPQIDFHDEAVADAWRHAPGLAPEPQGLRVLNERLRRVARRHIRALECGRAEGAGAAAVGQVDAGCAAMVRAVRKSAERLLAMGKTPGVLGGDHSTALGLLQALDARGEPFGILQVDAHMDLRDDYEGFRYSHASIMRRALELPRVTRLVQVAVRDRSDAEAAFARAQGRRVAVFPDRALARARFEGEPWRRTVARIVGALPRRIYVSFDVDGLEPSLCPATGTPVPGGLGFPEAVHLLERAAQGRRIVGFDVCETGARRGGEWDAAVAARILFRIGVLCGPGAR